MEAGRRSLPHDTPIWVDTTCAVYFITCCAKNRLEKPFSKPEIAKALLESVLLRMERKAWRVHAVTLMPDHVHLILGFDADEDMTASIRGWKRWTAREYGFQWQRDFFEHRLRDEESFDAKAQYVLQNPVRAGLVEDWRQWPYTFVSENLSPIG